MIEKMWSIGQVEKITGVSQKSLRFWEDRGYLPSVQRVICGKRAYRFYGVEDVELITRIKGFLDKGFTLAAASEKAKNKSGGKSYETE